MSSNLDRLTLSSLLVLGLVGACGDGDSDTGSSVTGSKRLLELTAAENQQLCKYYEQTYKNSRGSEDEYCTAEALFGVSSAAECEGYKAECIAAGAYDSLKEDWRCDIAEERYFLRDAGDGEFDCEATVAELEECIEADAARWKELTQYSCTQAGEANYPIDLTPECQKLSDHCADVDL